MLKFVAIALPLMFSGAVYAEAGEPDRIIGLLALPQLFGDGPCDRYESRPLSLFETADSIVPIGEVKVDTPWIMAAQGGCEGLEIGVHLTAARDIVRPLPTREFGYEEPGAVVFSRRGDRFRIALQDGAAWVEPLAGAEFHRMETLASENLSYLTGSWDGTVCAEPGRSGVCRQVRPWAEGALNVTILGHGQADGRLWFEIGFPVSDNCGGLPPTAPPTRAWIPAHGDNGEPAVWFYSRGC